LPLLGLVARRYFALLLAYSFLLKHLVIIDALTIAGGSSCGAAGAVAVGVPISHWLLRLHDAARAVSLVQQTAP
jgi:4-hydroxybenzoate polyprenyltransferase